MKVHRIKSAVTENQNSLKQMVTLDSSWVLSLHGSAPHDSSGAPVEPMLEGDDELTIGVVLGSNRLSDFVVIITDPDQEAHTLADAGATDGEGVTLSRASKKRTIKVKVVPVGDLPDP